MEYCLGINKLGTFKNEKLDKKKCVTYHGVGEVLTLETYVALTGPNVKEF